MRIRRIVFFLVVSFLVVPKSVFAIPPPDFIFNVGSQFVQIFSLMAITLMAFASVALNYFRAILVWFRTHWVISVAIASVLLVTVTVSALYLDVGNQLISQRNFEKSVEIEFSQKVNQYDQFGDELPIDEEPAKTSDPAVEFIRTYYGNLAAGNMEAAYAVSKQNVSFETYLGWYENVTAVEVMNIEEISSSKYSFSVQLTEGAQESYYAVVMELAEAADGFRVKESTVRVLSASEFERPIENVPTGQSFLAANPGLPLAVSNEEFESRETEGVFVLDAREDEEFEIGHYPGSQHIRFADLLYGSWVELPVDEIVYVICWSGIRGENVAEFLRSKGVAAQYLADGGKGWFDYGGTWQGDILFASQYPEERYSIVWDAEEVRDFVKRGAVLVDVRDQEDFEAWHIPGSVHMSAMFTPTAQFPAMLAQLSPNSEVITICDGYVNCFDAKIIGVKLEKEGHTFLGRLTEIYDY